MRGGRGPTGPGPGQGHDLDCKQSGGWQDWQAFLFLVVALVLWFLCLCFGVTYITFMLMFSFGVVLVLCSNFDSVVSEIVTIKLGIT